MELSKRNHFRHHIVYQYWYKLIRSGKNKAESGKSQGILKTYTSGNPDSRSLAIILRSLALILGSFEILFRFLEILKAAIPMTKIKVYKSENTVYCFVEMKSLRLMSYIIWSL